MNYVKLFWLLFLIFQFWSVNRLADSCQVTVVVAVVYVLIDAGAAIYFIYQWLNR